MRRIYSGGGLRLLYEDDPALGFILTRRYSDGTPVVYKDPCPFPYISFYPIVEILPLLGFLAALWLFLILINMLFS